MKNNKNAGCLFLFLPTSSKTKIMVHQNENFVCPSCDSIYIVEKIHPEQTHYGRLVCGDCGRFIRWLPKPKNTPSRGSGRGENAIGVDSES